MIYLYKWIDQVFYNYKIMLDLLIYKIRWIKYNYKIVNMIILSTIIRIYVKNVVL